jgi:acyl-homoserine lactone acylase PvdQ
MMRAAARHFFIMRIFESTFISAVLFSFGLLAASPAFAADKKENQLGTGKPAGKYLTRDELRNCMTTKARLTQQTADAVRERAELDDAKDALAKRGSELEKALESLDRTNAEAVSAYNEKARLRDQDIEAFQAHANIFNDRVTANKAVESAYAANCDNHRYFVEDEDAIKKGK